MKKVFEFLKKEPMLTVSLVAAAAAMIITLPSAELIKSIDWHTLAILFMMLTVLEGFKKENIFRPLLHFLARIRTMSGLSLFLVFSVFFSSMFVTNDVSLIIFVPITIIIFRAGDKERYILPVITMENIAAIRGSMLTPFGSPQNLFIFGQSGVPALRFVLYMFPLSLISAVLLIAFVVVLYRKDIREKVPQTEKTQLEAWLPERRRVRITYLLLFVVVIWTIVGRTELWLYITIAAAVIIFIADRSLLVKTDYVLLLTFLCFFVFSSSIAANERISGFLQSTVAGHEYAWSILLSQIISNVPASIVLYPFSENKGALLYGLDSAGLCSLIGSLASVINYRLYVREYPKKGGEFIKVFTLISLLFFAIVVIPGYILGQRSII